MACTEFLKARVSPDVKLQVKAVADRQLQSESAWLKQLVLREIRACDAGASSAGESFRAAVGIRRPGREARGPNGSGKPMLVRLCIEDKLLLDARAEARGMPPATYSSVLLRSHLRKITPLPKDELLALKRSIALLASIGRNINQIAKVANQGGRIADSAGAEFRAMLKICVALRDNTKALLKANETSWKTGHAQADI
jgi:Bacterial mobilisation protein (MobC)